MQQRERFGAACLALCLGHDGDFCASFLDRICGVKPVRRDWRVNVDPYHKGWADILIDSAESTTVVECKINDELKPKQNPWHPSKQFIEPEKGYGWYFNREFSTSKRTYVTLTASTIEKAKCIAGTDCRTATWTDVSDLPKTDKWIDDLFLSLANLDYPAFRLMKTKNLRVNNVESVISCHEVLAAVADRLGVAGWSIKHYAENEEEPGRITGGYVGIELIAFKKTQPKRTRIEEIINPPSEYKAWFGYDLINRSPDKPKARLSIWFYCGDAPAMRRVKKCIGRARGWKLVPPARDRKLSEKYFLQFETSPNGEKGDVEQFLALLTPVIPEVPAN
jgi:hypothetical protein